ncbi:unnamed protein product [Heligmosomoides polygyrus]|uniref:Uncharacterized protein n=1 Tax=Heligmosomoides polygyrus TaxID=6339 RepID=A0A183G662_HELPZ|nr:unnamed protein product [Heligmosomoides polygyrus]
MLHEAVVRLVDVVHDRIFPKAGKRGVKVPAYGRSGTPLLEFRGLFFLTQKNGTCAKVVRYRVELGDNGDVSRPILAVEDDVIDIVVEVATGIFPGLSEGFCNCEFPWMVRSCWLDELRQSFTLLVLLQIVDSDELFRRPSGPNLGDDDHVVESVSFPMALL